MLRASAKDKGRRWENQIVTLLVEGGYPHAERRRLTGARDKGDISGVAGVMIEAKAEAAPRLTEYLRQVSVQRHNAEAAVGVAWVKRPGLAAAGDGVVVMYVHVLAQLRWNGLLLDPLPFRTVLAHRHLTPDNTHSVQLLVRPSGKPAAAAVSGAIFPTLLKNGGY